MLTDNIEFHKYLTIIGLFLDIIGATFLAKGAIFNSPLIAATQGLKSPKSYKEALRLINDRCTTFSESLLGLLTLSLGFSLQILAAYEIHHNVYVISASIATGIFLCEFCLRASNQYRVESAIEYCLATMSAPLYVDRFIDQEPDRVVFSWPTNIGLNETEFFGLVANEILVSPTFRSYRGKSCHEKSDTLRAEIEKRYFDGDLPLTYCPFHDPDPPQKNKYSQSWFRWWLRLFSRY